MFKVTPKHKHSLLRGSLFLLSPLFTLISFFLKKNDAVVLTSSLNKEFSDNTRALFEALYARPEFRNRVYFVLNDTEKAALLNQQYPGRFLNNTSFKNILFILRAKYWFSSALEMPAPALFQRFRRTVIHLGHGMLYKRIGLREQGVSWYKRIYYFFITSNFSYTIATTEFFLDEIAQGFGVPKERILLLPQPKTALLATPASINNSLFNDTSATHVLHAPTWRPYADVQLMPFADQDLPALGEFLEQHNIHIWIRVHPRNEQHIDEALLATKNIHLFSGRDYSEVNAYLAHFAALITDYSSIYFDFLTLQRPVLFLDYDLDLYVRKVGVVDRYQELKSEVSTLSQAQLIEQLAAIKCGDVNLTKIQQANALVNFNIPNEEIINYVIETLFGIKK
ncbi:MAG: CDP-glycerol glycerophosphotransferase family protein [Idiomarina sp.]|nr:CDP-glycerol glycerophosphotransferase family protein [Idiomarina sp.]